MIQQWSFDSNRIYGGIWVLEEIQFVRFGAIAVGGFLDLKQHRGLSMRLGSHIGALLCTKFCTFFLRTVHFHSTKRDRSDQHSIKRFSCFHGSYCPLDFS